MFTGIIETTGTVRQIIQNGSNRSFWIESSLAGELVEDQSVAHNGACLTVEQSDGHLHQVTAIAETLLKTNLSDLKIGDLVNLERCLQINGRIDGHLVQGHVDTTGTCSGRKELDGSWLFRIEFPGRYAHLVIEKGSIALNGISLTVFEVRKKSFSVAIIPYTFQHTAIGQLTKGGRVNIEFDMIGKYVEKQAHKR